MHRGYDDRHNDRHDHHHHDRHDRHHDQHDRHNAAQDRRGAFKQKGIQARSMDDSNVNGPYGKQGRTHLKRGSSETNLANDFLGVPNKDRSSSKYSLIDKFADVSKAISDKYETPKDSKNRPKSPFSLFKKKGSRDPSPAPALKKRMAQPAQVSSSEYSEESESDSMTPASHSRKPIKKTMSDTSYGSENLESEGDIQELEAYMDVIDEYYYGVRVFPGQDPTHVYVGWVTPGFHSYSNVFDMKRIRNVVICQMDYEHQIKSR